MELLEVNMNSNIAYYNQIDSIIGAESSNQVLSAGSQVMISMPTIQGVIPMLGLSGMIGSIPYNPVMSDADISKPRTPRLARGQIIRMDDDFNLPLR
jgi:hypothetical protein